MSTVPVVIVNPNSQGGRTRRVWPRIEASVREALGDFRALFTERSGHATELARTALREGADLVIALGGDGTLNEVANGFFDDSGVQVRPSAAIALLPAGTGGDFIRTTGAPRDLLDAARHIAAAKPRAIDVGRLRFLGPDDKTITRYFLNIASFGASGLIDRYVNESSKAFGGKVSFLLGSLRGSLAYRNARIRLSLDDAAPKEQTVYLVAVANGRFFGGGMKIAPTAELDDSTFEVVTIGDVGVATMFTRGLSIYSGAHVDLPFVTVNTARKVFAESATGEEVLLDVDGEQPGRLPATIEIIPRGIQVMA